MPKLSVSVPDELWQQAQSTGPDLGPSQLVQTALQRFVAATARAPSVGRVRPANHEVLVDRAKRRLSQTARERYEAGYRAGITFAESVPWGLVDQLSCYQGELPPWIDAWQQRESRSTTAEEDFWAQLVQEAMTEEYARDSMFRIGFADALDDVRVAVTLDPSPTPAERTEAWRDTDEPPWELEEPPWDIEEGEEELPPWE